MAYVKTTWHIGDVITAEKLNNIENGLGALQPLIVTKTEISAEQAEQPKKKISQYQLDKTFEEIYDALIAGKYVPILMTTGDIEVECDHAYLANLVNDIFQISTTNGVTYFATSATGTLTTVTPE